MLAWRKGKFGKKYEKTHKKPWCLVGCFMVATESECRPNPWAPQRFDRVELWAGFARPRSYGVHQRVHDDQTSAEAWSTAVDFDGRELAQN
jgi:hypothetical protein